MSWLKFTTEHIWVEEQWTVFISAIIQSLTCLVVIEGSVNAVLRSNIQLNALKEVLNLEEEVWWCFV